MGTAPTKISAPPIRRESRSPMVAMNEATTTLLGRMGLGEDALQAIVKTDTSNLEKMMQGILNALAEAMGDVRKLNKTVSDHDTRIEEMEAMPSGSGDSEGASGVLLKLDDLASKLEQHDTRISDNAQNAITALAKIREIEEVQSTNHTRVDRLEENLEDTTSKIANLEAGLAGVSSRVLVLEDSLTEGFEKQEQALQLVGQQLQRLATDQNELLIKVANCQDDLIEKVDVASLEPLRAADRELMAQLTQLGEELLSKMAEMAAKDHLTRDDLNHLVTQHNFENAGERTQRQLSVLDIGLTRLAKMIKMMEKNMQNAPSTGDDGDDDLFAGFMYPIKCMSCSRTKSPGKRTTSPVREVIGTDGVLYGNTDCFVRPRSARTKPPPGSPNSPTIRRNRPKSAAVTRSGTINEQRSTVSEPVVPRLPEMKTVDPDISPDDLMAQYGIEPGAVSMPSVPFAGGGRPMHR